MKITIVTGLSGAGKSQAVKALEDLGYYCVDNIPPVLVPKFAELCRNSMEGIDKLGLVMDIRGGRFFDDIFESLDALDRLGMVYDILFLEASDKALIKRFKETRRAHPMAREGRIEAGIARERKKLEPLKGRADTIVDTSDMTANQLKNEISKAYTEGNAQPNITITVLSFGFKEGLPIDADLVFDVRFLPNPFYVEALRPLTGNDEAVQNYVMGFEESRVFMDKLMDLLNFLIPQYLKEGKNQLTVGIGCTGGKHRSVTLANKLGEALKKLGGRVVIVHRDADKGRAE